MRKTSYRERKLLSLFFSNLRGQVFVLLNMPEVLKGALFSRYSRSNKSLRELFLDEYLLREGLNLKQNIKILKNIHHLGQFLNTQRAREFYRRWLAQYGDDSIAELGGIHIGIENISVVATKAIEDRRIGLSPLEKSTRYVRFDTKVNGKYLYYRDKQLLKSRFGPLYLETMDSLFTTYSKLIEPLLIFYKNNYPKPESVSDNAYAASIRSKACDTARGLLPLGVLTNMGIFSNGRALEYLLTKMSAQELPEAKKLGQKILKEAKPFIGSFLERLATTKGKQYVNYIRETQQDINPLIKELLPFKEKNGVLHSGVELLQSDPEALYKIAASILYPASSFSWTNIYSVVKNMTQEKLMEIVERYVNKRNGRWHKVGRAFEEVYYSFEIISDHGVYKDLQRHRILTNFRQRFTTEYGFETPKDIVEAGLAKHYNHALNKADRAYQKILKTFPEQAQYLACHGHLARWRMKLNLREAFHLCELRSSPQGHPAYRKIAQDIYRKIKEADPILGTAMKFINFTEPGLERLGSEIRIEEKMASLGINKNLETGSRNSEPRSGESPLLSPKQQNSKIPKT